MLQGRDRKSVYAFFKDRGKEWCESVKVVTCDLWRVYKSAVRKFLPNATVVTDKFHVFKYTACLLKEQVIAFYEQKSKGNAEEHLKKWASACIASGLKPFVQLGKRLLRHARSILEYFVRRVSNGFAEGINNKIKVIKRMAFGFHDFEYFRLKILSVTGYLRPYPRIPAF